MEGSGRGWAEEGTKIENVPVQLEHVGETFPLARVARGTSNIATTAAVLVIDAFLCQFDNKTAETLASARCPPATTATNLLNKSTISCSSAMSRGLRSPTGENRSRIR